MSDLEHYSVEDIENLDPAQDPRFQLPTKNPKRAEFLIGVSFFLAFLGFIAVIVIYELGANTEAEGALLAASFGLVGAGMIAWGKYLLPKGPFEELRHPSRSSDEERKAFVDAVGGRGKVAVLRRGFLLKLLGLSLGTFSVAALFPLLDSLGPAPGKDVFDTPWKKGSKLLTINNRPISVNDVDVGGFLTVFPEGGVGSFDGQTLLIRVGLEDVVTKPGRETWGPKGFLAYSKVCTHAGCPITLYQQQTQQLLCPCHQSLFNVLDGAEPVFGPAARPLPQLPLYIDSEGYLRAQGGYDVPIGPGFWNF